MPHQYATRPVGMQQEGPALFFVRGTVAGMGSTSRSLGRRRLFRCGITLKPPAARLEWDREHFLEDSAVPLLDRLGVAVLQGFVDDAVDLFAILVGEHAHFSAQLTHLST